MVFALCFFVLSWFLHFFSFMGSWRSALFHHLPCGMATFSRTFYFHQNKWPVLNRFLLWMNYLCAFCSDWRKPTGGLDKSLRALLTWSNSCILHIYWGLDRVWKVTSHRWGCTLISYSGKNISSFITWEIGFSFIPCPCKLGCEWCVCQARTGNHSVTWNANMFWLMLALGLASWNGQFWKDFTLSLIWRFSWLNQIA